MVSKAVRVVILIVVFVVLVTFATKAAKGIQASNRVKPRILNVKPEIQLNKVTDLLSLRTLPIVTTLALDNFSDEEFELNQIYVEIYTEQGELIASQNAPLPTNKTLLRNSTAMLNIRFDVTSRTAIQFLTKGTPLADLIKFATGGKLGKKLNMKGFIVAEGIKASLDELVEI